MYVIAIHSVSNPDAFWGAQLDLPQGTELPIVVPSSDGTRGVCVFTSDSVDTVRNLVDGAAGAISSNEYHAINEDNARGLPIQSTSLIALRSSLAFTAIEGYFETLAREIAPFGIRTVLVEPGMVRTSFYDAADRVPLSEPYRGGPADFPEIPVDEMPGSQSGVAHAIVEAALSDEPPLRLLLNSDAYDVVTKTPRERLNELEAQRECAYAADAEYAPAAEV